MKSPSRAVTDDEIGAVFTKLDGLATAEELTATHAGEDPTASDAALCVGLRAQYAVVLRLPAPDLATYARYAAVAATWASQAATRRT